MSDNEESLWLRHLKTLKGKWVVVTFMDMSHGNFYLMDSDEGSVLMLREGNSEPALTERSMIGIIRLDEERARGVWQRRP